MNKKLITTAVLSLFVIEACCGEDKDPLIFSTNECQLTEPVYGHKFDFSALRSDIAKVANSSKGDIFEYNICGNLSRLCDGKNVAACLRKGDKEYILGTQQLLHYRRGKMYFEFSDGAKCPSGDGELKLHVFVGCDYTLDAVQSQVTQYSNDACTFYITLETPYACLPEPEEVKSNGCIIQDPVNGHTYDLLSLSDFNYRTTDRHGNAFVINICKPVLYGENAMCPIGSSVCFIQLNATDYNKRFFNYGSVQPNPTIENGQLIMRLPSTTACNGTDNYSSIIQFICEKEKKSAQLSMVGINGCVYKFSLTTPLACNNYPPCTTITHGSEILDMRPLQGKPYTLSMDSKNYTFGICSGAGQPCLENDGACLMEGTQTTTLGQINSQLRFNHSGSPYLLYTDGAQCDDQTKWSTKIEFVCANNATKDNKTMDSSGTSSGNSTKAGDIAMNAKIIENKNCQLLIHVQTPLACQEQINCKVKVYVDHSEDGTGEEWVDLTPLISATDNYEAKINTASITEQQVPKSTKFFLNVCRPLVPKFGLGCQGGSAACMARVDSSSSTPEEEQSLGFPLASLVAINRTTAELRYLQGSTCPTDSKSQLSSSIEFYCDMRAGLGTPRLQTITDCHYQFQWATNVICPSHMCNFNEETCEIINDDISERYNLKKALFAADGKVKISNRKNEFTLDFCGTHRKAETDYSQGLVNLFFSAETPCGTTNVQLQLICSGDTQRDINLNNSPKECNLVLVQRTPEICEFLGLVVPPPVAADSNNGSNTITITTTTTTTIASTTTSSTISTTSATPAGGAHPAEQTGSIGAILAAILSLTCFVACLGVFAFSPERRNSVRRLFRRSTTAVRYSRVQSNEEANLLLEPNGEFTESDDDMLL
ncbi:PREDICTED: cation-independent mannose-6-phosphate receptor [Rhagoletis zephyria]|uniref:cation-independent mannose-6-phosphate receptor n=1 Tax=Rhagoletis zephyria TaxID=28612 RepID=UPI0008114E6B|nr:PREDICTED: cation-independent mannose-6-phosphate receptor [Rhagoletis zephyria]